MAGLLQGQGILERKGPGTPQADEAITRAMSCPFVVFPTGRRGSGKFLSSWWSMCGSVGA